MEVKSFVSKSKIADLHFAVGQFVSYQNALWELEPDRSLYLAVRESIFNTVFQKSVGSLLLKNKQVRLLIFDPDTKEVKQWIA